MEDAPSDTGGNEAIERGTISGCVRAPQALYHRQLEINPATARKRVAGDSSAALRLCAARRPGIRSGPDV